MLATFLFYSSPAAQEQSLTQAKIDVQQALTKWTHPPVWSTVLHPGYSGVIALARQVGNSLPSQKPWTKKWSGVLLLRLGLPRNTMGGLCLEAHAGLRDGKKGRFLEGDSWQQGSETGKSKVCLRQKHTSHKHITHLFKPTHTSHLAEFLHCLHHNYSVFLPLRWSPWGAGNMLFLLRSTVISPAI